MTPSPATTKSTVTFADIPEELRLLRDGVGRFIRQDVVPAIEHGRYSAVIEPSDGSDPARAITTTARRDSDNNVGASEVHRCVIAREALGGAAR